MITTTALETPPSPSTAYAPPAPPVSGSDAPPPLFYGAPAVQSRWRVALGRAAGIAAIGCGAVYLTWRVSTLHDTGVLGAVFFAAEALNYLALVLTVPLIWRVARRPLPTAAPTGTLDVFVTVCGEPPEFVAETLEAALAIRYPHRTWVLNDGRVAGHAGWEDIDRLAAHYRVGCFTRTGGALGKAANLNHALSVTDGEFIGLIDADHRAIPGFADATLGYFCDDRVAFVCTPQQFQCDDADVLNNRELFFYRVIQPAKDRSNSAFSCGNGTLLRRRALESIGGFSEWNLVEDLHTSYELHARGWRSIYHPGAITTGAAPHTFAALAAQRLRWATDSVRLLLWDSPLLKRGLTLGQRVHYFHTVSFYVVAATQVLFIASPMLWLWWSVPTMRIASVSEYLIKGVPFYASVVAFFVVHVGWRGAFRIGQQQLSLAPVYVCAVWRALTRVRARETVTRKVDQPRISVLTVPTLLAVAVSAAALGFSVDERTGRVTLAGVWAGWFAFMMVGGISAIGTSAGVGRGLRALARGAIIACVVLLFVPVRPDGHPGSRPPGPAASVPRQLLPPAHGAYMGVFNPDILRSPGRLENWSVVHGTRPRIVNSYQQWLNGERWFRPDRAAMVARQGGVLMITWEPWAKPRNGVHDVNQRRIRLNAIAAGRFDPFIRRWAAETAAYRQPLLMRFMHEMNGGWYPWSIRHNGNTPAAFVRAWRHVHGIFRAAGADNVSWVWTVNTFTGLKHPDRDLRSYYPGSRYVDWVSATGFNWGSSNGWDAWRRLDQIYGTTYAALRRLGKPVMLSEIGTVRSGGDAGRWVRASLAGLEREYPLVKAVVWFDVRPHRESDFRLRGARSAAFASTVRGSSYWSPPLRYAPATR